MKTSTKLLAGLALASAATCASAVQFNVTSQSFTPGSGYNTGGTSTSDLGAVFSASGLDELFALATVGDFHTYKFGAVTLYDGELFNGFAYIDGGILGNETNDLTVSANFQLSSPLTGPKTVSASGTAVAGLINPRTFFGATLEANGAVDLTIDWADELVDFGNGGQFRISMNDLAFDHNNQTLDQNVTITLVTAPIPEPETYALMLAGLGVVGFMARRRKQA